MGCGGSKLPRPHSTYDGRKKPKVTSAKRRAKSLVSLRSDAVEILSNEVDDSESQPTKQLDFVQSKPKRLNDTQNDGAADDNISELDLLPGETSREEILMVEPVQVKPVVPKINIQNLDNLSENSLINEKQTEAAPKDDADVLVEKMDKKSITSLKLGSKTSVQSSPASVKSIKSLKLGSKTSGHSSPTSGKSIKSLKLGSKTSRGSSLASLKSTKSQKLGSENSRKSSLASLTNHELQILDSVDGQLQELSDNHTTAEAAENDIFETDHTQHSPKSVQQRLLPAEEHEPQLIPDSASAIHEIESLDEIQVLPDTVNEKTAVTTKDSTKDFVKSKKAMRFRSNSLISAEYNAQFPDGEYDGLKHGNITESEYRFICDEQAVLKEYNESLTELRDMGSTDLADIRNVKIRPKIPKSIDSGVDDLYISELAT